MSGFDSQSVKTLTKTLRDMRDNLDRVALMPLEEQMTGGGGKGLTPFTMCWHIIQLLPQVEAALWRKGVDPRTVPGSDWTEILAEVESELGPKT